MTTYIDYYKILDVPKEADEQAIKKAYRKLARKYHPDLNPGDKTAEKKFKEINEANEVLGNPENRKKYDKYGKDWEHADEIEKARRQQRQSGRQSQGGRYSEQDYSDFFESMFGSQNAGSGFSGFGREAPRFRGQDYHAELSLPLIEVYRTQKQTVNVNGKSIRFTIPAGVKDQQIIKIKGYGGSGANGGPAGDLYIKFNIQNDTGFKRDGDNLYKEVDLDIYTAVLGGDLTINTLDGKVRLKVGPETGNGTKVKLKGKGFPKYKKEGQFGDLYIIYKLVLPKKLTAEEKALFTQLSKLRM